MKVLIGVDPHKASVTAAAVDEVLGEFVECATFMQNRAGLRALKNAGPKGLPSVVGRWRTPEVSANPCPRGWQRPASRWWTCPPSFQHGCGCSQPATLARTMGWTPSPLRAGRLAQGAAGSGRSRGRCGSTAPAFRKARGLGRRAYPSVQPPARIPPARLRSRRGAGDTLDPPSRSHLARHTTARLLLGPRPPAVGFGDHALSVRALERKIADLDGRIEAEVEASATTLTEIFGIGPILAAKIIGTVGNVVRFPTKAHYFASYSGTAPGEVSSGEVVRHRLSLAGNPHLNNALHMVAVCQARSDVRGGVYYRKTMAEGKSGKEALRCLKKRISDAVFKSLMADLEGPSCSVA